MSDNSILLEVKNLNVELEGEKIIENLSFQVKKGEFYIILGPNGAGKTTLFKALLKLIPSRGEIKWKTDNLKIGYLPERLSRDKFKELPMSVRDFYKFKEPSVKKILEMLEFVGLNKNVLDKDAGNLSSGQYQRMLIGWALLKNPQILFFDEPTTGIDIGGEETIYSLLKKFWQEKGLTVFLITHDLNVVYGYSTNVLCLYKKGVCSGPPREVLTPELLEKLYGNKIKFYKHTH